MKRMKKQPKTNDHRGIEEKTREYTVEKDEDEYIYWTTLFKASIVFAKSTTTPHYKSVFCQQTLVSIFDRFKMIKS